MATRSLTAVVAALIYSQCLASGATAATTSTATGTVTNLGSSSLTIQTPGRMTGVINALTVAASALTKKDYAYVWGGGHAQAGVPSVGIKGPGYNGRRIGFDCSGSVAAVLTRAGLWPAGAPVPADAGIIAEMLQDRLIAPGAGKAPDEVTLYDDPGVHIFMNIDGRFFGTSDGGGGNSKGGPTWLDDGAPDASDHAYKRYHVLPSVLKQQTSTGLDLTFQLGPSAGSLDVFEPGDHVNVSYQEARTGSLIAHTIGWVGALSASTTIISIADGGSSFTAQTASGRSLTFSTGKVTDLIDELRIGDTAEVIYTKARSGLLTARSVTVTAFPVAPPATGTITAIASDSSSFTLQTAGGQDLTISTIALSGGIGNLAVGDDVQVTYVQALDGTLDALQVTLSGDPPGQTPPSGTAGTPAPTGASQG